jgi:hypothetical protein
MNMRKRLANVLNILACPGAPNKKNPTNSFDAQSWSGICPTAGIQYERNDLYIVYTHWSDYCSGALPHSGRVCGLLNAFKRGASRERN